MISALSEAVGKSMTVSSNLQGLFGAGENSATAASLMVSEGNSKARPETYSRYVLFRFLARYQEFEPQAWLKNVEGVDLD